MFRGAATAFADLEAVVLVERVVELGVGVEVLLPRVRIGGVHLRLCLAAGEDRLAIAEHRHGFVFLVEDGDHRGKIGDVKVIAVLVKAT